MFLNIHGIYRLILEPDIVKIDYGALLRLILEEIDSKLCQD
jgi:hypothetical protein